MDDVMIFSVKFRWLDCDIINAMQVIGHLERIVRRRSDVLGVVTSHRRTPKSFTSAPDLASMIEWLFTQTSSTHAGKLQ